MSIYATVYEESPGEAGQRGQLIDCTAHFTRSEMIDLLDGLTLLALGHDNLKLMARDVEEVLHHGERGDQVRALRDQIEAAIDG